MAFFTVFRLLTDFVCLYNYEFGLSLCKIVRSSVILLLPLFSCGDLVQVFLKKWWVESDFKAPNLPLSLRSKVPAVTITVFKYRNKIGEIVVKEVPYSVDSNHMHMSRNSK
jgi:hypothetical protein